MPTEISFVNFNSTPVATVINTETGQVFVPVKPICEAIGVDWSGQHAKIQQDEVLNSVTIQITYLSKDGKNYKMTCLPLDYLNGWLFKINPSKIRNITTRQKVINFQKYMYSNLRRIFDSYTDIVNALNNFEVDKDIIDSTKYQLFVYAIQESETKRVKLGISANPERRLKELQTGNSQELVLLSYIPANNGYDDEKRIHEEFSNLHVRGEWYKQQVLSNLR